MIWLKWISPTILLLACCSCQQQLAAPTVSAVARPTVLPDEQAERERVQQMIGSYIDRMEKNLASPTEESKVAARRELNQRRSKPATDEKRPAAVSMAPAPAIVTAPATSAQQPTSIEEFAAPLALQKRPELPHAQRCQVTQNDSSIDATIEVTQRRIQDEPGNTALEFDLRILYLTAGDDAAALTPIEGIPESEREIYRAMIMALLKARDNARSNPQPDEDDMFAENLLPEIETLIESLRLQADLKLLRLLLVRRVVSYGVIDVIEPAQFKAGKVNPVIVYAELDNFSSEVDEEGRYLTRLSQQITIYTKQGHQVSILHDPLIKDISTNRRQDFFLARIVNIPAQLPPGEYVLKLAVEDKVGKKAAEATTTFKLIAAMQ